MELNEKCFLWSTLADRKEKDIPARDEKGTEYSFPVEEIFSPRTGGWYFLSHMLFNENIDDKLTVSQKHCLTKWLVEKRKEDCVPFIDEKVIEDAKKLVPMKSIEKAKKLLTFLTEKENIWEKVTISRGAGQNYDDVNLFDMLCIYANCEIYNDVELIQIISYLEAQGLIQESDRSNMYFNIALTFKGKIATEQVTNENSDQGFIAMWFDESMNDVSKAITKGIEQAGYKAVRIDNVEHNKKIDDEIIASIKRARFVVADFTHGEKDGARGGVYYEAGFAHGLGIPVIFTCQEDIVEDIHFDTRQYNHITWKKEELDDLTKQIALRIAATIKDGPHKVKDIS